MGYDDRSPSGRIKVWRQKRRIKNYSMEIIGSGGEKLKGNWTGGVQTKVENSYFSIPVVALYQLITG